GRVSVHRSRKQNVRDGRYRHTGRMGRSCHALRCQSQILTAKGPNCGNEVTLPKYGKTSCDTQDTPIQAELGYMLIHARGDGGRRGAGHAGEPSKLEPGVM